jgi:Ala-tRNA(Pro) deacylase
LVLKVDDTFGLFVLNAASRLDSGAVRRLLGARRTRFASREELFDLTGLEPGAVPPFGPPILDLPLHVDRGLVANGRIAFNAGSLETSVVIGMPDYLELARPTLLPFATAGDGD